jgi:sugar diacid utilization regulator/putative methionine-R-sulfoxide reductase with GAF domain
VLVVSLAPEVVEGVPRDEPPMRLARGIWSVVEPDAVPGSLARSALEAARTVFSADYCAFVWRTAAQGPPALAGSQGISEARLRELAGSWLAAVDAGQADDEPAVSSPELRIEPVLDHSGRVRGAFVVALRGAAAHSPDARMLMPVFASHLGLLAERSAAEELRSASYQALVQIGTQIQAVADVAHVLQLIVDRARELIGTDVAWMGLVDDHDGTLEMAVASGARTRPFMGMRLHLGDGVGGVVVSTKRPVVLPDYRRESLPTPPDVRAAVLGEGIGSMLSTPMLRGERVIGVLYVGSRHPMQFPSTAIALTSALAAQAAVAIENARLYAQLESKNRLLEDSFAIHRVLTDAALAGSGPHDICAELARRLGVELTLIQEVCDPFAVTCRPDGTMATAAPGDRPPGRSTTFPVVGDTELGRLELSESQKLSPLQQKALEHGATVIALELVKQRAAQDVAWQLQSDLLGELLDAPAPLPSTLVARARRHGVDLSKPHRVIAIAPAGSNPLTPTGEDLLVLVRRVTGRSLLHRDAALVNLRGAHVILAPRDDAEGRACAAIIHAVTAAVERAGGAVAVGVSEPSTDLASGYRQAVACATLAAANGETTRTLHADALGPLRFVLDSPDLTHVQTIVRNALGPLTTNDGHTRTELLATLRAFIAADGNVARTAEACFVHKNTLRYRLGRIHSVLGRDPSDPDTKFELRIAFGLLDLFAGLGIDLLDPG